MSSQPLQGQLVQYSESSKLALFESGDLSSSSVLIFIGGLTDGPGTVGYVPALSAALAPRGWSVAEMTLSSSYLQYGIFSLEQDAKEIGEAVDYFRNKRGKTKIVLHGHSTGCQDSIWYLTRNAESRPSISGAILQAPVSDLEYFQSASGEEAHKWALKAKTLVEEGRGDEWLPKEASLSLTFLGLVPFSAYRFASLFNAGGDDDFFSSSTPPAKLKFRDSFKPLLLLLGNEDEYYPKHLQSRAAKQELLGKWVASSNGKVVSSSEVVEGANHTVDDPAARERINAAVIKFVESL